LSLWLQQEDNESFAVGHLSLGYLLGRISAKVLETTPNMPIIFVLSVIPDIDILIPILQHRVQTHSAIVALIIFLPFFVVYRKKSIPYFIALVQHALIGDYLAGGRIQLFWPATSQMYGLRISITSQTNVIMEWVMFITSIIVMLKTKDIATFFQPHSSNLILAVPTFTVLLPTFLSFPLNVPLELILPHLVYMALFSAAIIYCLSKFQRG
jgi:hypothetical protein